MSAGAITLVAVVAVGLAVCTPRFLAAARERKRVNARSHHLLCHVVAGTVPEPEVLVSRYEPEVLHNAARRVLKAGRVPPDHLVAAVVDCAKPGPRADLVELGRVAAFAAGASLVVSRIAMAYGVEPATMAASVICAAGIASVVVFDISTDASGERR